MRYLAVGRIHPERTHVSFGPLQWTYADKGRVAIFSDSAQLSVLLDLSELKDPPGAAYCKSPKLPARPVDRKVGGGLTGMGNAGTAKQRS